MKHNKPTWVCLDCKDVTWKNTKREINGRGCPHCGSQNIEVKHER